MDTKAVDLNLWNIIMSEKILLSVVFHLVSFWPIVDGEHILKPHIINQFKCTGSYPVWKSMRLHV